MNRISLMFYLSVLTLLVGIVYLYHPFLFPGWWDTDDGYWMAIRLSAFYEAMRDGQFPVRLLGRLNHLYGYPVPTFLYPGFLYLGTFFRVISGLSFIGIIKLLSVLSVAVGAYTIWKTLRTKHSYEMSALGSLLFLSHPYLLYDVYVRGSIGEIMAMAAFAVLVAAIYHNSIVFTLIAFVSIVLFHNTLALLFTTLFGLYIFISKQFSYGVVLALGLAISGFFWIPALYEQQFVRFGETVVSESIRYFAPISLVSLASFTIIVLALGYSSRRTPLTLTLLVASSVAIMLSLPSSSFLWRSLPLLGSLVQFPYRFLSIVVVSLPFLLLMLPSKVTYSKVLIGILVLGQCIAAYSVFQRLVYTEYSDDYISTNLATTTVKNEYMPNWVSQDPSSSPAKTIDVRSGSASIITDKATNKEITATVQAMTQSTLVINRLYYPGWGVLVNNKPVDIEFQGGHGVIMFSVPAGNHIIRAIFRETPIRMAANVVSLGGCIGSGVYLLYLQRRKKT